MSHRVVFLYVSAEPPANASNGCSKTAAPSKARHLAPGLEPRGAAPVGKIGKFSIEAGASHSLRQPPADQNGARTGKIQAFSALKMSHFGRFPAALRPIARIWRGKILEGCEIPVFEQNQ